MAENYKNAMEELKVPIIRDAMGGNASGAYWFTQSVNPKNETRSTSQGFYTPSRPNLHLLTDKRVAKIIIESGKVEGIEFSAGENATMSSVLVSKEVILSAGALHTPQILQLSGIGETAHLLSLGIDTVVDLPGVGWNYHDHLLLFTGQTGKPFLMHDDLLLTCTSKLIPLLTLQKSPTRPGPQNSLQYTNPEEKAHSPPSAATSSRSSQSGHSRMQLH